MLPPAGAISSSSARPERSTAAAFSPDGNRIATASDDLLARIYYSADGRLLAPLAGHGKAVTSVEFDPSGRTIVTGSSDGTARLWEALPLGTLVPIDRRSSPVGAFWAGEHAVSVAGRRARILTTSGRLVRQLTMPSPIVATCGRRELDPSWPTAAATCSSDRRGDRRS